MNLIAPRILILLLTFMLLECTAQQNIKFSKPGLSLEKSTLVISFDIINSTPSDKFIITLEVTDSTGKRINPTTITGDLGENITGGRNKVIQWDLQADRISVDQVLFVELVGKSVVEEETLAEAKQITRIGGIARSVAFPGWGLSLVHPGKPHWIKGVVGYCSIGGALVLNQRAYVNYENYLDSDNETERIEYYDKSLRQEQLSLVFACTAVGVWAVDILWTIVGIKNPSKHYGSMQRNGFSVGTTYESVGNTPLLSLKYTF